MKHPPRMSVFKSDIVFGPGSDPDSFPEIEEYMSVSEAQEIAAKAREDGKASALRFALHLIEEHGIPEGIQAIRANAARCAPTQPSRKGEKE